VPMFLQPLTALLEGRALQAPRVLELESSSGLLQVSLPYPKGGLRRRHAFIMPHAVCIYVHKIVLQFYVCFVHLSLMWSVTFFLVSPLVRVVQSCHRRVYFRYMQFIRVSWLFSCSESTVDEWLLLRKANANEGPTVDVS
jgi:hypothetical protein